MNDDVKVRREVKIAALWGLLISGSLAVLILVGSRNLANFDAVLVGYTFATLFSAYGVTYRYSMWLQRPPTAMYWRRGWQVFFRQKHLAHNIGVWFKKVGSDFLSNRFIRHRDKARWMAHLLIMWGCILAAAVTFPLVFGWIHFETVEANMEWYRVFIFGFPTFSFPVHSILAFVIFHALVWASFLVIPGVMLAMRRRMREHGAASVQSFASDILPLLLLFAVSVTGLMLTACYTWMKGHGFEFLAVLHAITVIFTLIYLPFGKFFHIFQRPAQLGVAFYQEVGAREGQAVCARCEQPFAPIMQIDDLITVEKELGYNYQMQGQIDHYQRICPGCRRRMVALAQGSQWWSQGTPQPNVVQPLKPREDL
ncbi:MAG: MFS transporter [Vulcanimicrobiota bacterium]